MLTDSVNEYNFLNIIILSEHSLYKVESFNSIIGKSEEDHLIISFVLHQIKHSGYM